MRVVIDAFGGDNAPAEIVKGAALASNELNVDITLTGDRKTIENCIKENGLSFAGDLKIIHTEDVISMHDEPTSLVKAHKGSSMALAFVELAEGRADAFVSAGSTGAVVVGGTLIVKRAGELGNEVSVAAVNEDDVHSGSLHSLCRLAVFFNGLLRE